MAKKKNSTKNEKAPDWYDEAIGKDEAPKTDAPKKNDSGLSNLQLLYTAGGTLQAFSAISTSMTKASAIRAKGKFEEAAFIENAKRLKLAADDAKKRGHRESYEFMKRIRGLVGAQRAALGAQGIEIDRGSAADIQEETIQLGLEDSATIRTNALREAYGYKKQAIELETQAEYSRVGRKLEEKQTLIAGRTAAANSMAGAAIKVNRAGSA